jgi:hypothetical protein
MRRYDFAPHFNRLYPSNAHLQQELRQTMQHLRDKAAIVEFTKPAIYRRIK